MRAWAEERLGFRLDLVKEWTDDEDADGDVDGDAD